jgi:hypothetical protein
MDICGKNKAKQTQFKANSKPISSAAKMEISDFMTGRYGNMRLCGRAENKANSKPIQTQFYPKFSPKIPKIRFFQFLISLIFTAFSPVNPRLGFLCPFDKLWTSLPTADKSETISNIKNQNAKMMGLPWRYFVYKGKWQE